jgi:hypothetical protein
MLTCTGSVIAVHDFDEAARFWESVMGFERAPEGDDDTSFVHPATSQRITLIEVAHPNPPMALAIHVEDVDDAFDDLVDGGFEEHWSDTSPEGDDFSMCRNEAGVYVLLYSPAMPAS